MTPATGIGGSHSCGHQRQPTARTVPETPPASGIGGSHYCGHQRQPTARTVPETPPASGIGGSHYCGHQRQPTSRTVPCSYTTAANNPALPPPIFLPRVGVFLPCGEQSSVSSGPRKGMGGQQLQ
ncbi:uncharacterized protein LOC143769078 [Ranitomeya variabilis]|uniref:uncharacterized protein LOC143769078 n=1 Tax=Ranitomeya variabilis TaxID=490064 RepID=UPI004056CF20